MKLFKILLLAFVAMLLNAYEGKSQKVTISVRAIDELTQKPAIGVNISYYNKKGQLIACNIPTNNQGRMDFDADFKPGDKITVIADKPGTYAEKEETLRIVGYGGNENEMAFRLVADEGKEVNIIITSGKKQKPVPEVIIRYKNHIGKVVEVLTDENGVARFPIYNKIGREMEFNLQREGYFSQIKRAVVGENGIDLNIDLERQSQFTVCDCMPYTTGGLATVASGTFIGFKVNYKQYKNFKNLNRFRDLDSANTYKDLAFVSASATAVALTYWLICKNREKKREKDRAREKRKTGFLPFLNPVDGKDKWGNIGIAYKF